MGAGRRHPQSGIEATVLAGCSLRTMAVNAVLPTLVNSAVYLSDEDPELVRNLLPFLLKTIESIIEADPARQDVLLFANTGFVLYANAFLQADAALAEWDDYDLALELNERALRMYLRARDYGLRNVEVDHPGITARLQSDPETAVAVFGREDVESLYYLGGAWMLAISLGLDRPGLIADAVAPPLRKPRYRRAPPAFSSLCLSFVSLGGPCTCQPYCQPNPLPTGVISAQIGVVLHSGNPINTVFTGDLADLRTGSIPVPGGAPRRDRFTHRPGRARFIPAVAGRTCSSRQRKRRGAEECTGQPVGPDDSPRDIASIALASQG